MLADGTRGKSHSGRPVVHRPSPVAIALLLLALIATGTIQAGVDFSRVGYRTNIVLNDGSENSWSMGESFTETQLSTHAAWLRLKLNLKYSIPEGDLRFGRQYDPAAVEDPENVPGDGSLSGLVEFRRQYLQTSFSIAPRSEWASLKFNWRHSESDDNISAGFHLHPSDHLNWGITRSLSHPLPSLTKLYYYFEDNDGDINREGGNIVWEAPAWTTGIQAQAKWFGRFTVSTFLQDSDFRPSKPHPSDPSFVGYTGVVDGKFNSGHISCKFAFDSSRLLTTTYQHIEMNGRFRTYFDGKQFAYFGVVSFDASVWSMSYSQNGWRFNVMSGNVEGNLGGSVEAWPFLDGLARFLGERRHVVCEGDVDFQHAAVTVPIINRKRLAFGSRIDYLNLTPDLRYASWRPVMFGFGIDDLKSERFEIKKAGLLRLSIHPAVTWKNLRLEGSVSQWVPMFISKLSDADTDDTSGSSPTSGDDDSGTTWGGFSASIRLTSQL